MEHSTPAEHVSELDCKVCALRLIPKSPGVCLSHWEARGHFILPSSCALGLPRRSKVPARHRSSVLVRSQIHIDNPLLRNI
jgi:hypothetical protein